MKTPCEKNVEQCPYQYSGCFADTHHEYFPRSDYRRGVARQFRELPENKVQLCRNEHDELHAVTEPPIKPSREEMMGAIALSNKERGWGDGPPKME